MKTIRSVMTLAGFSLVLVALGAVGASGQISYPAHFAGTFTLPTAAQWGGMTLPAGDYTLQYGTQGKSAQLLVVVQGTAQGSPHGVILAGPVGDSSATRSALVCVREGDALIVRALEMPAIGESVKFALPPGAKLAAHNGRHGGYAQLAEAPVLVQRIPVTVR